MHKPESTFRKYQPGKMPASAEMTRQGQAATSGLFNHYFPTATP